MTNEEMVVLIQQGKSLMGELYMQNKRFIQKCVKPFQSVSNDIDDLMQIAYFGLEKAVRDYKPELEYKFLTFAKFHIINTVRREVNRQKGIPDRVYTLIGQYKHLFDTCTTPEGKSPSEAHIMALMNISQKELKTIKKYMVKIKSLDKALNEDTDMTLCDTIADDSLPDMNEIAEREDLKRVVWEEVDKLQCNHKDIIYKRYKENRTLRDLGAEYGVSYQCVRQKEFDALRHLRRNHNFRNRVEEYIPTRHVTLSEYNTTFTRADRKRVV